MAIDKKTVELIKKATADIIALKEQNAALTAKLNRRQKFASLKFKKAELVEEVIEEVKDVLLENDVPSEEIDKVVDVVQTAVEAVATETPDAEEQEMKAEESDVLEDEVLSELGDLATSDEIDDDVKTAALNILKSAKDKRAFGKTIVASLRRLANRQQAYSGYVGSARTARKEASGVSKAVNDLLSLIK